MDFEKKKLHYILKINDLEEQKVIIKKCGDCIWSIF